VLPHLVPPHAADLRALAEQRLEVAPQVDEPVDDHRPDDHDDCDDVDVLYDVGDGGAQPLP
jgi:hypothetical protein